jgi:hypothetical protein
LASVRRVGILCLWLTVAGAAMALVVGGPQASAATRKAIWGSTTMPDGSSAFPVYRRLGVKVFQYQLRWDRTAPTQPRRPKNPRDPAYRWPADVDRAVRGARANGIRPALMVKGSPSWANGGRPQNWVPRARAYANFLVAATRRYPSVRLWMIWGEPSRRDSFSPMPTNKPTGPRLYARLLDRAYVALKRRSRKNVVIGGGTFTVGDVLPAQFVKWMRVDGRPPRLDWYAHNPFSGRFPKLSKRPVQRYIRDMSDVDTLYSQLKRTYGRAYSRFRHTGPKLWLSEFTVSSDRPNRAFDFYVSRSAQARWLTRAYRIAASQSYIAGLGWFNLYDEPASMPLGLTTGLMTFEGVRKPAFRAYRRVR